MRQSQRRAARETPPYGRATDAVRYQTQAT